jgi:hypothetical protein
VFAGVMPDFCSRRLEEIGWKSGFFGRMFAE